MGVGRDLHGLVYASFQNRGEYHSLLHKSGDGLILLLDGEQTRVSGLTFKRVVLPVLEVTKAVLVSSRGSNRYFNLGCPYPHTTSVRTVL